MIITLIILLSAVVGYLLTRAVPYEHKDGQKWFLAATIGACVFLFTIFSWWKAAIIAGAILFGSYPALLALGWLAAGQGLAPAELSIVLGILIGTRWCVEKRSFTALGTSIAALAAVHLAFFLI